MFCFWLFSFWGTMSHGFMWCFLSYSSAASFVIATMILIQIYLYFYSNFSVAWRLEVCLCFSVGDIICCCLVSLTHAASAYIWGSARSILSPFIQVSMVFLSYGLGGGTVTGALLLLLVSVWWLVSPWGWMADASTVSRVTWGLQVLPLWWGKWEGGEGARCMGHHLSCCMLPCGHRHHCGWEVRVLCTLPPLLPGCKPWLGPRVTGLVSTAAPLP